MSTYMRNWDLPMTTSPNVVSLLPGQPGVLMSCWLGGGGVDLIGPHKQAVCEIGTVAALFVSTIPGK